MIILEAGISETQKLQHCLPELAGGIVSTKAIPIKKSGDRENFQRARHQKTASSIDTGNLTMMCLLHIRDKPGKC